jgi:phosphoribosylformylglycinamidine synthase
MNVACSGARPIGITNCLNFASPERAAGYWQLAEAIDGMVDACRALEIPIVSGNVSLYNETPAGPILPTPVIGTVGLLEDRSQAVPMAWQTGDQLWLLGDPAADAASLAASELAWRRARFGGAPRIDVDATARLVTLLVALSGAGITRAAHDLSVGGLGVALARMAVAAGCGATIELPDSAAAVMPSAALFGERAGRAIVGVHERDAARFETACREAAVPAARLGIAGGDQLRIGIGDATVELAVSALVAAWETPF